MQLKILLSLKSNIAKAMKTLDGLDDVFKPCVKTVAVNFSILKNDVNTAANKVVSLNPLSFVTDLEIEEFQTCFTRLNRTVEIILEEYEAFTSKRDATIYDSVCNKISRFLKVHNHYIEFYGFICCCSKEHLVLGQGMEGQLITMPHGDRTKHMYINGLTGAGKSCQLESLILQSIFLNQGGVLLEPFGGLTRSVASVVMCYENMRLDFQMAREGIVDFLEHVLDFVPEPVRAKVKETKLYDELSLFNEILEREADDVFPATNVTVMDLSAKDNPYHINPFVSTVFSTEEIVHILLDCIALETGTAISETPQAANVLGALFSLVSINKGTINDLLLLFSIFKDYQGQGKSGATPMPSKILENMWNSDEAVCRNYASYLQDTLLSYSGNAYGDMTNSSRNRLSQFLNSKLCDDFFNCSESTLSLDSFVNSTEKQKPFLLIHVPSQKQGSGIIGHFLYRSIAKLLYNRDDAQRKNHFYWFIDEYFEFLGGSKHSAAEASKLFSSIRQFGCGLCVALQHSNQTKLHDPSGYVFHSVVSNAYTTMCFRSSDEDAKRFACSLWNNKGNLVEVSYSVNNGETRVVGVNESNALSQGWNASHGESKTLSESNSKAVGHTVTASTNSIFQNSQSQSKTQSNGDSQGRSGSKGLQSQHPHRIENVSESTSTVISASHNQSSSTGNSTTAGESNGKSQGKSDSETVTSGHSTSTGERDNYGISQSTSNTMGASRSLSMSNSYGRTLRRFSIAEEEKIIAQEIRKQADRELFVSTGQTLTKAVTLDALTVKLNGTLSPILDDYYGYLGQYQNRDILDITPEPFSKRAEVDEKPVFVKPKTSIDIGTGDVF